LRGECRGATKCLCRASQGERVEAFGEPAIDRSEKFAGLTDPELARQTAGQLSRHRRFDRRDDHAKRIKGFVRAQRCAGAGDALSARPGERWRTTGQRHLTPLVGRDASVSAFAELSFKDEI
jgi:hypothetical protein